MEDILFDIIKQYTEIPGPPGHEGPVADTLLKDWKKTCKSVKKTKIGNIIAKVGGKGPKLLITAHMDEIALLVKSVTKDGFLRITHGTAGSEFSQRPNTAYLGQPVLIMGKKAYHEGILTNAAGHAMPEKLRKKEGIDWDDIFIDMGLDSRDQVESLGIRPGRHVIFNAATRRLGNRIIGKAMDDRLGLAIMTFLASELKGLDLKYELYLAATIMEEIALAGAITIARDIGPDLAIALEIGLVGDIPNIPFEYMPASLGNGPIIAHKDSGTYYSSEVADLIEDSADKSGIKIQHAVFQGFGSDGIELIKEGVPTALFTFPTRYTHCPYEMVCESDINDIINILKHILL